MSGSSLLSGGTATLSGSASVIGMDSLTQYANYNFTRGTLRWCLANEVANSSDPGASSNVRGCRIKSQTSLFIYLQFAYMAVPVC